MKNTDLPLLLSFLRDNKIPNIIKKPITFLGISKQPHYENVWSNIYAFFLDISGEHGFEDLFLSSLIEVISKKTGKQFTFDSNFRITTEFTTQDNGRIDLLLCNDYEAIIIENKVFHLLNNNLDDYWNSIKVSKKQGVILSLQAIDCNNIKNNKFENITHIELMNVVMDKIGKYISGVSDKYLIFLKDFYQNIINVTNSMEKELINFYFNHSEKSNQIAEIRESYIKHIICHVEDAPKHINEKFEKPQTLGKRFTYYRNITHTIMFSFNFFYCYMKHFQ
ncbi:PD-(D/E)XK nuclease superfamily protein [Dysgonomonas alginatilytica]|uniref:PD-(D/E)XK nuclease superfamily protein n=1 Tax=Dysgonomonas alginatilytica TaxID=1605892 RepID=A0A2V3PLB6_9BACT|nr:PD-(D/E)XK nuclease superfamily protein [Dysgonomonas alginatilytica]